MGYRTRLDARADHGRDAKGSEGGVMLSRRDFLRGLGAVAGGLLVPKQAKLEAERLVTPEHGGLLVGRHMSTRIIDNFGLRVPQWTVEDGL